MLKRGNKVFGGELENGRASTANGVVDAGCLNDRQEIAERDVIGCKCGTALRERCVRCCGYLRTDALQRQPFNCVARIEQRAHRGNGRKAVATGLQITKVTDDQIVATVKPWR